ncbi:hypothetical protein CEXT_116061 [Caerostris extrusa]|uniref:Uncharacterized protein n=1 Tax=Caerostris extrusa TaxID=172846 RepID=A0AAV4MZR2_CAEEX|nr:hypothetical protein CEXT_116061 [Caerostris extrusa]
MITLTVLTLGKNFSLNKPPLLPGRKARWLVASAWGVSALFSIPSAFLSSKKGRGGHVPSAGSSWSHGSGRSTSPWWPSASSSCRPSSSRLATPSSSTPSGPRADS